MALYKPRRETSEEINIAVTLISDFYGTVRKSISVR
jgi:hypothetical protein